MLSLVSNLGTATEMHLLLVSQRFCTLKSQVPLKSCLNHTSGKKHFGSTHGDFQHYFHYFTIK